MIQLENWTEPEIVMTIIGIIAVIVAIYFGVAHLRKRSGKNNTQTVNVRSDGPANVNPIQDNSTHISGDKNARNSKTDR